MNGIVRGRGSGRLDGTSGNEGDLRLGGTSGAEEDLRLGGSIKLPVLVRSNSTGGGTGGTPIYTDQA